MSFTIEQNSLYFKAVDDVIIIWIDDHTIPVDLYQEIRKSVVRVLYTIHSSDFDTYLEYMKKHLTAGTVVSLIAHNRFIDRLLTASLPHVVGIYALGDKYFFRWVNTKVRDVFDRYDSKYISKKLREDFENHFNQQWSMGISIFQRNTEIQRNYGELSRHNVQFMWYQLLVKILTQMPPNAHSKDDMLQQSFLNYKEDTTVTDFKTYEMHMHEFKRHYTPEEAIKWFTRDSFAYRLLNEACRTSNIDLMFVFRCLIRDIFIQLKQLHIKQKQKDRRPFTVYRGTTITQEELELLQRNSGNLISRHQFLSTTIDGAVASIFIDGIITTAENNKLGILEEIYIDPTNCQTTPYADVSNYGHFRDEGEILLSMGSVFRVKSVSKINNGTLWTVKLDLIDKDEKMTEELHQYLELNIENEPTLLTLSTFLLWMGKCDKARYYCDILLTRLSDDDRDRPTIYTQLGYICQKMGQFDNALQYLNQSIEYLETPLNNNKTIQLSCAYNDRGLIYKCRGDFDNALNDINKALELRSNENNVTEKERQSLPVLCSHVYENLGIMYKDNSKYDLALNHLHKALDLRQKHLPKNHYWTAQTYNNLCLVYTAVGNHQMAIECIQNAIDIQRQALPENHPNLATMYQTQGNALYRQGQYTEALSNFQRAYDIYRSMPYCDPLMVAAAVSNIGSVFNAMGNYAAAYPRFEEALNAQRQFASKHPNMISTLNNIAMVCSNMGDNEAFMNYSQEALRMCCEILGEHHENTGITYLIIAQRLNDDQYNLAMDYFDRVLNIYTEHLHLPCHNNVIGCYIQMGVMERKQRHFEQAHQNFTKAADTHRCSALPKQHPLLTKLYTQTALTYLEQDQVEGALHAYEQAIEHTPTNSPELSKIRQEIETLHSRSNMTNSCIQGMQRTAFYLGIIGLTCIILFRTFYKT